MILLLIGAFSRMFGGKKDQVANNITTHRCTYFFSLKRLKND